MALDDVRSWFCVLLKRIGWLASNKGEIVYLVTKEHAIQLHLRNR